MSVAAPLLVQARRAAPPTSAVVAKLDDPIERTIEELRELSRTSALQFAIQVGSIIVERFYGSDPEQWRRRGPKHASFRKLAAHPSLPFSPGALYRAVAIYELTRRLAGQESVRHLGCSHLRAVLGLCADEQSRLLDLAYGNRWTVEQLEREAALVRLPLGKGGRRPTAPFVRAVRAVRRGVENELLLALDELDATIDLGRAQRLVLALRDACAELESLVAPGCV